MHCRCDLMRLAAAIEATPDESLRDAWIACDHGTAFYYLALSELTSDRAYSRARLMSDRADYVQSEPQGGTMADMAWIDDRRGK